MLIAQSHAASPWVWQENNRDRYIPSAHPPWLRNAQSRPGATLGQALASLETINLLTQVGHVNLLLSP